MENLTLVKRIELAMAADTSGPGAANFIEGAINDYIPPCPMKDESNCRPGDLMDSGKSAKYKTVVIPSSQWFDLKMDIANALFDSWYDSIPNYDPYKKDSNGDLVLKHAPQERFEKWYDHAENILLENGIDCVETGVES